jgi:predicted CxxxxCH...CXXCH cytochrome family protein
MASRSSKRSGTGTRSRGATYSLVFAVVTAGLSALVPPGCMKLHEQKETDADVAKRPGDALSRSAPPFDLLRQTAVGYPGVGAHSIHLNASETHGAVACDECHVVPDSVDAPGHADDARPADITFGALARTGPRHPTYDVKTRTCANSYCHREAWPVWSAPRTSAEACGSCHGLPPPEPHPQSDRCSVCHADVIAADRHFIDPERHVDGIVDYAADSCTVCHGSEGDPAPPFDTSGNDAITALGVGAHQAHLLGGDNGRPLECGECHRVPERVEEPTHVDGLPAEVSFTGVAASMGREPHWNESGATCSNSWCHSPSPGDDRASPVWNVEARLDCTSCHGAPPPAPHPQMTTCSLCHAEVVGSDDHTIVDRSRHVNGVVEVAFDRSCNACHGGDNAAPPMDLLGNTRTTASGVGAHQTHVLGTERSRPVPCGECHVVPDDIFDPGHFDTARPAELAFSGVALANGASPTYENGTCGSTSCHGAVFSDGNPSGGSNTTPTWTHVDGTEAACGSCHGLPPPPPHPGPYPCDNCHGDIAHDGITFTHPELHVDGVVTFDVP